MNFGLTSVYFHSQKTLSRVVLKKKNLQEDNNTELLRKLKKNSCLSHDETSDMSVSEYYKPYSENGQLSKINRVKEIQEEKSQIEYIFMIRLFKL